MFARREPVQNEVVAKHMRRFFTSRHVRGISPDQLAEAYGRAMWSRRRAAVVDEQKLKHERFTVALATDDTGRSFDTITKRATLISDTLLLSHVRSGEFHQLGVQENYTPGAQSARDRHDVFTASSMDGVDTDINGYIRADLDDTVRRHEKWFGMYCPDLNGLGAWLRDAEPLLRAGLAWYLPCYATASALGTVRSSAQLRQEHLHSQQPYPGVDYLIRDRRAVDASGASPLKSRLVRPVLTIDLPFVDGVGLRDFSEITTQEFASYASFRDHLRLTFNDMDDALNAVQSERELVKHGLHIKEGIRAVEAEMAKVKRKRAVAVSGAAIGTVGAVLVAVYGPAMQAAIAVAGAGGGVWGVIHAVTENSKQALRSDKWYYVWVLARKHNSHIR
ncbi:hypothetical protein [Prauserella cavernicola]|uniref:Uncharacterized protein n=1 Tax=Prauserella cavernicola TaxID=2800127 RepID=A0A934QQF9_9PSEU|nr:hypothetical protein [Prauserella cavernicola]MBK1783829.1 hypothetical protein [Prauserella cavernicola]